MYCVFCIFFKELSVWFYVTFRVIFLPFFLSLVKYVTKESVNVFVMMSLRVLSRPLRKYGWDGMEWGHLINLARGFPQKVYYKVYAIAIGL